MTDKPRTVTLAESDALRALPTTRLDPQALISKAIEQGAGIETLERLVQLAKDIRAISAEEAFNKAIAEFQRRCPPIKKNRTGYITDRATYKYSDLGEIEPTIAPLCGELGLSHSWESQPTKPGEVTIDCRISHEAGHSRMSGPVTIPYNISAGRMNPAQTVGSALTYAKRYSLTLGLGISPEDDDDAGGTGGGRGDTSTEREKPRGSQTSAHVAERNPQEARGSELPLPEQPHAPADPNIFRAEAESLFQPPDAERDHLIVEINSIINRVIKQKRAKPDDVRQWKKTYLGHEDADILKADPASLADFSKYLLGRFGA
jgi:hypothetical protein